MLGEHGAGVNPVADQVNELQQILKIISPISATASVGTLATSGPAGIARSDTQVYTRAGYNPVYSTWDISASANKATLNWAAANTDSLKNPVVRVLGYSIGTAPSSVTFNGSAMVADTDYLASVDTATGTLWVTLLRTISNATNTLAINAAAVAPACSMDIDGDGQVHATTDGLIIMRAMLGMRDTNVSSAAAPGSPRSTWTDIRDFLVNSCGMVLP